VCVFVYGAVRYFMCVRCVVWLCNVYIFLCVMCGVFVCV